MFSRKSIPIDYIRSIFKTNSIKAAPAPSLDRLSIVMKSSTSVVISPKDKKGFISSILSLNESVEI